ncbi:MAG: AMP-binding protein, partial [Alphaproteobacteria bacterium]
MEKPAARTAPALLEELAAQQPNHQCVIDGGRRWSYAQMQAEAQSVAAGLCDLGIRPGHRVAILMGNRAEWLSSYFAILGLGAEAVALNTWLTPTEQAYQLNHAEVTTLILADRFKDRNVLSELDEMRAIGLPNLKQVIALGDRIPADVFAFSDLKGEIEPGVWGTAREDDVACILYTSGSTARPKGVPLKHGGLID